MTTAPRAAAGAYIAAIDYAVPARVVSNGELAALHPEWNVPQVASRSGVESRHWCGPSETALDLGEAACRQLVKRTGADLGQVDALLFCTQSPDYVMPPNACLLQHRLGLSRRLAALDYSLACSGFVYGLYLGNALISSGAARQVLLVTADTYSKRIHPDDRGPVTLFGDGAAATLLAAGEAAIGAFSLASDGASAGSFMIPAGGAREPSSALTKEPKRDASGNVRTAENIYMDGPAVLDFVKQEIPSLVRALLVQEGLTLEEIDLVVFHQGSRMTLDHLHKALRIPPQKQFSNLAAVGNTVSASIPIALRDAELQGRLKPGMRVLLVGFGVGLSWGACLVDWR
jgi:3-oxoacyl-[acyl-carrier-protein] synthase III